MIPNPGAAQSDTYLLQQINSASPEQLCIMLLEGAQRFLLQAITATKNRNIGDKARYVNRVSAIIEELMVQVDTNDGNELAINLSRIYEWWMGQLFEGSRNNRAENMEMIYTQMNEMKLAWMQVVQKAQSEPHSVGGLGAELMG
jgi:flagellar protein FliS